MDTILSIKDKVEGLYKDKGSRFISFAYPVENEEDIKLIIDNIKKEYYDARHHCYAYRLGVDTNKYRANDDGEPSGTAGRPILGIIDSKGLTDILVVVVRYFGGIKLGVPGLIKAYKEATLSALEISEVVEKIITKKFRLIFNYEQMNMIMKIIKDLNLEQSNQNFNEICSIDVRIRLSLIPEFYSRFDYTIQCQITEL